MGVKPLDVLTTKEAAKRKLGEADIDNIEVLGESIEAAAGKPFILPQSSMVKKLPQPVISIAKNLIRYYPYVRHEDCIKCAACIDACPKKVIRFDKNKRISFDYSGCIACFCCLEACPASAIKIKKSILAKLIGL
jgi:ferredoxin